ncbi:EscN/YscN/HrcN family type III secretion system ATPase [Helicobacter sp. 16-1353]|uniref:flagellar protein export ATPase FliI n=1 Tax=Helicobacter sp. 16-1353 TaxID=2004996 RepID=UPI000DCCC725|nr:flagellar protein export ATPase FliI [Helicobacter sp. 16-1353]RAX55296.1 EscN/YscN/HrcN family type III secretion system ATPase [Helicobacter sp. 16-1353]
MSLEKLRLKLERKIELSPHFGEITQIYANTIKANGLKTSIGDIVSIKGIDNDISGIVSAIERDYFSIIPFTSTQGYKVGDKVFISQKGLKIGVGNGLLGRIVDPLANPIDNLGEIQKDSTISILNTPIKAMNRGLIDEVFSVGVKSVDGLLTCGKGQKMGIFAGSGVGKSTLIGMIVRGSSAEIKVIALIGERGREVPEFIAKNLGNDLKNTIIVVATSDDSPLMRKYGAFSAMSIAEYFKNQGKDVLFIMDSVTRFAMAQREIGLSLGEPPTSKGYPPSVLSLLPKLMERAGKEENKGSITAFFTILVEGDDLSDPIADQSRSILDGHIVLSRELSEFGIYPPINILASSSRVMNDIIDKKHRENVIKFRKIYSLLKENEVLIRIGSYQKGSDKELDYALSKKEKLEAFLQQDSTTMLDFKEIYTKLDEIFK